MDSPLSLQIVVLTQSMSKRMLQKLFTKLKKFKFYMLHINTSNNNNYVQRLNAQQKLSLEVMRQ